MSNTLTSLALVVLLLVINGFFVAAEFALVKAKGVRIDQLAGDGNRSAILTRKILDKLESYLAACQLGITMASLGLGWVGEPAVAALLQPMFQSMGMSDEVLHTSSFIIGFLLFSSLHIVVGEQVPKTFAIRKPEPVSLWVAYPLWMFYVVAWPLTSLLSKSTSYILRSLNVAEASHTDVMTGAELRDMIGQSEQHGQLAAGNAEMLLNLFDFGERTAKEVMVPRTEIEMLDLQTSPEQNIAVVLGTSHSRFPVVDGSSDKLAGLILTKDLFNAALEGKARPWENISEFLREPLMVPENLLVARLFERMRVERAHMAFVMNEYGSFVGLLTMEDLLEEIVGEIADELDEHESEYRISQLSENTWKAHGLLPLSDLEKALDIDLPDEVTANTISGLFMNALQQLPETGATVTFCGYQMTVREVEGNRVHTVKIEKLPASNDGTE